MTGSAARAGRLVVWLGLTLAAGCGDGDGSGLEVARRVPLPDSGFASLHVDPAGRFWAGRRDALVVLDSAGALRLSVPMPGGVPRVVGDAAGRIFARAGDRVWVVDRAAAAVLAERPEVGRSQLLVDVRGRYLFQGTPSGAVLAHDPATLDPLWAWGARGMPTTALAPSPEGDRLYQALAPDEGGGVVLVRDLQTGRVLSEVRFAAPIRALVPGPGGELYGVIGEGDRRAVLALRPLGGRLELLWRRPLRWAEGEAALRLLRAPGAPRLLALGGGDDDGLRVLDAEAGTVLASRSRAPRDAAFGPDGRLYLLTADAIQQVRRARR